MNSARLFAPKMNLIAKVFSAVLCFGMIATAQAQLTWEKTEIELHPKSTDGDAVANFKYQNRGKTPIRITSVKSSCGCTVASSKKDDVAPGEKGEVTATFHIGGRTGLQQKTITVETNDTAQPVTSLVLKAMIEQAIDIQPTFVFWQAGEAPKPKMLKVKLNDESAGTKLDATSSSPDFTTKVEKGAGPNEFTISVQPKDSAEPHSTTITIKSALPQPSFANARVLPPASTAR